MRRPLFFIACMVLMGAVMGRLVVLPPLVPLAVLALVVGGGVVALARKARIDGGRYHAFLVSSQMAGFFCLAFFMQNREVVRERVADAMVAEFSELSAVTVRGIVADEPVARAGDRRRATLVLRDVKVSRGGNTDQPESVLPARCQVSLWEDAVIWEPENLPVRGQCVEVTGRMRAPPEASHADLFDYRAFLRKRGIAAMVSVWAADSVRLIDGADRGGEARLFGVVSQCRRSLLRRIDVAIPAPQAGVLRAMLLGETSSLDQRTREVFTRMGGAHLFAVSGLHTMLLALMVFGACRLLMLPPRASAWVMLATLCLYILLVGFRPPVVRASIISFALAMPFLFRRAVDSLNALALAAFLTVLVDPLAPFRSDFQFSYLCAFGLIVFGPTLREILSIRSRSAFDLSRLARFYNTRIAQGLSLVIAVQLITLPLLAIYYHQISFIGFFSNLIMVPLSGVVLGAGWLFAGLGWLTPGLGGMLAAIASGLTVFFVGLGELFAAPRWAASSLPTFPWWLMGCYYALLLSGPHLRMRRAPGAVEQRRGAFLWRMAAVAVIVIWWPIAARFMPDGRALRGEMQVSMIDVGQGDSILLHLPNDRALLIDTGPAGRDREIASYLRAEGIDELDALILTHADADHIGSAAQLLDRIPVDRVYLTSVDRGTQLARDFLTALDAHHLSPLLLKRGDRLQAAPSVRLEVLSPPAGFQGADRNETSLVLLVEYGETTFLLTGDAGEDVEEELLSLYGAGYLQSEILKTGHHGSQSSSSEAFLRAVSPDVALISAGKDNRFGHPHPSVIGRLQSLSAVVFNTANSGTVELRTDGRRCEVRPSRGEESDAAELDLRKSASGGFSADYVGGE